MKIGFIGVGHLASALIGGMLKNAKYSAADLFLYDFNKNQLTPFTSQGAHGCISESDVVANSDLIVMAIRPSDFETAMAAIRGKCPLSDKVFVSTAAGISTAYISHGLGGAKVVRTMPNTPLSLGYGATAICAGNGVTEEELKAVYDIFASCGSCVTLPESRMNEVIAINGSSPAYVYYLAEAMTAWATEQGFDEQIALSLIAQTLIGSAQMLLHSEKTPAELRQAVCSPGGTTIEAINVMKQSGFAEIIARAMQACTDKAEQLGR